jgi:pimeloyl-ACP methyl ester carboxylesterase
MNAATSSTTPSFTEHRIASGQGRVYARDYAGSGPAFVLMHGFPDNLHIYDELIPHLVAAGRRVVSFDFLGFGQSDKPDGAVYHFAQQLGDLRAVVAALDLERIVPVAHDAAGPAAVNFALEQPGRVAALHLLNTLYALTPALRMPELIEIFASPSMKAVAAAFTQSPEQFGWLLGVQQALFHASLPASQQAHFLEVMPGLIGDNFRQQPSALPAFAQMNADLFAEVTRNAARLPEVAALEMPVKIIWGQADPYLTVALAEDFRGRFKHVTLDLVEAGHWLQIDAPARVAALMTAE